MSRRSDRRSEHGSHSQKEGGRLAMKRAKRPRNQLRSSSTTVTNAAHAEFEGFAFKREFTSTRHGRFLRIITRDREDFGPFFEQSEFRSLERTSAYERSRSVFARAFASVKVRASFHGFAVAAFSRDDGDVL